MPADRRADPATARFEILGRLGAGGTSRVYLARDRVEDGREVALKIFDSFPRSSDVLREFRLLRELRHPHIARAYDFGRLARGGKFFLSLEHVAGSSLEEASRVLRADRGPGIRRLLELFLQVVEALRHLHESGLVHLDVKPSNIVVAGDRAKLIDFGIVRSFAASSPQPRAGTAHFMAPEILQGGPIGPRTDLYSLGAAFYRAFTGKYPIDGLTPEEIEEGHRARHPAAPDGIDPALGAILLRLLAKSPSQRFESAAELAGALRTLLGSTANAIALDESALVGRRREMDGFFSWWERLERAGGPRALALAGRPGIGKSRLIEAIASELLGMGASILRLRIEGHRDEDGLERLVRKAIALSGAALGGAKRGDLRPFRFLLHFLGIRADRALLKETARLDGPAIRSRVFHEAEALLQLALAPRGAVLIDDLDRAGPQLVEFARFVAAQPGGPRTFGLIASERKIGDAGGLAGPSSNGPGSMVPAWSGAAERIEIAALGTDDAIRLVRSLRPGLDASEVKGVVQAAGGNPGLLVAHVAPSATRSPKGRANLALSKLGSRERTAFLTLALLGRPAGEGLIRRLCGLPEGEALGRLAALERKGLIRGDPRGYYVSDPAQAERLVRAQRPSLVQSMHLRIGAALLRARGAIAAAARHLIGGNDAAAAIPAALAAAGEMRGRGRIEEALDLLTAASRLAGRSPQAAELWEEIGDLQEKAGRFEEAASAYSSALRPSNKMSHQPRCERRGAALPAAPLPGMGRHRMRGAPTRRYSGEYRRGRPLGGSEGGEAERQSSTAPRRRNPEGRSTLLPPRLGDCARSQGGPARSGFILLEGLKEERIAPARRARLLRKAGGIEQRRGRNDEAYRAFETALATLDAAKEVGEHLFLLRELSALDTFRGEFDRAAAFARRGLEILASRAARSLSRRERSLHGLDLHLALGHVELRRFDYERAAAEFQRGLRLAREARAREREALLLNNLAIALSQGNRLSAALRAYERASRLAGRMGDDTALFSISCNIATIQARMGRVAAAGDVLRRLALKPQGEVSRRGRMFLLHSQGLIDRIALRDARPTWEEAIRIADELPDPLFAAYGRLCLLENEIQFGRWEAARAVLSELEDLKKDDLRFRRAVDARRALLEARCGRVKPAREALARLEAARDAALYRDKWDSLYAGAARLELGDVPEAETALVELAREFESSRQLPSALECRLLLADAALRRRDTEAARTDLARAERLVARHDAESASRNARERIERLRSSLVQAEVESGAMKAGAARHGDRASGPNPSPNPPASARPPEMASLSRVEAAATLDGALKAALEAARADRGAVLVRDGGRGWVASIGFSRRERNRLERATRSGEEPAEPMGLARLSLRVPGHLHDAWLFLDRAGRDPMASDSPVLDLAARLIALRLISRTEARAALPPTRSLNGSTGRTRSRSSFAMEGFRSPKMRALVDLVLRTRGSDLPILLVGESGSGKDYLARWIHSMSLRARGPFVVQDCAALPQGLIEADIFGYEAGAFTGAEIAKTGHIFSAQGGTYYLDRIDTLPLDVQAKLLRLLEDRAVRPLGGKRPRKTDIRIIASAVEDLRQRVARGEFREDLYFRLAGITLNVPPLRERVEDIPAIVADAVRMLPGKRIQFGADAIEALKSHPWPGNVRELESAVRRLALTSEGRIDARRVGEVFGKAGSAPTYPRWIFEGKEYEEAVDEAKREYLLALMDRCDGDLDAVARELKTSRRNLYFRLAHAGIRTGRKNGRPKSD